MDHSSTQADGSKATEASLAGGFVPPTEQEWLDLAAKVLKGAPIEKLDSKTEGGLRIKALYTRSDTPDVGIGTPGTAPFTRGSRVPDENATQWNVRTEITATSPADASSLAIEALERGASELSVVVTDASDGGAGSGGSAEAGGSAGDGSSPVDAGVRISGVEDLNAALADVMVDLAPVYLRPGAQFGRTAGWLASLWEQRGVPSNETRGGFGADPIGVLASEGHLPQGIDGALTELGELSARYAQTHPGVATMSVDTTPYANAGADEVQELALMLSTGAAYLRACAKAGLAASPACRQVELTVTTDADIFTGVAKIRAARRLWSAVAQSCGADTQAQAPDINVRTSETMMTRRDPWVNLLRVTTASLAAGLGGAHSVTTLPYDWRLAEHSELGRRMARNTQLLLQEESHIARVVDPMGGSWYIESLTNQLVEAAWARFQSIERNGGMPAALVDGTVAGLISTHVEERFGRIATRREPITGVSEFPNINEATPSARATGDRTDSKRPSGDSASGTGPASGRDSASGTGPASGTSIEPLPVVHWADPFEDLRDRSDNELSLNGSRPKVFLVNLGPVATHTARATFAKNFFEAGGIEAVTSAVGSSTGFTDSETVVKDAETAATGLVCICSSDEVYAGQGEVIANALRDAGLGRIHLAGNPGELEDSLRAAGVDEFIYIGVNVLDVLTRAHDTLGTPEADR